MKQFTITYQKWMKVMRGILGSSRNLNGFKIRACNEPPINFQPLLVDDSFKICSHILLWTSQDKPQIDISIACIIIKTFFTEIQWFTHSNFFRNINIRIIHTLFIDSINGFHSCKWIHITNTCISITIIIFNHKILFNWIFEIPASLASTRFKIVFTYFVVICVAVCNWLYVVLYFVLNVVTFDFLLLLTIRCQWFDLFAWVRLYLTTVNS